MSLFPKIAGTFSFKLAGALLNLLIAVLVARYLGPAGKGEASLLIANITIILLFTGILGGTALIYLTPRHNPYQLLLPAYTAAGAFSAVGAAGFWISDLVPPAYALHLGLLALLHALFAINLLLLLGRQQVLRHNVLTFLVPLLTLGGLIFFCWRRGPDFRAYQHALYLGYGTVWLLSSYFIWRLPEPFTWSGLGRTTRTLCRYGLTGQFANMIGFLNTRLSFYLLNGFGSLAAVGIYSVGVSLAEALWLVGRSMALVLYTQVANSPDAHQSARETARLARLSFWLTGLGLALLLLLPPALYQSLFGPAFGPARAVILLLSPGILAVSLGNILIHYFSGIGRYRYNVWAAGTGLLVTLPAAYTLIPAQGLAGAALATSLSQLASTLLLLILFCRQTGLRVSFLVKG